MTPSEIVTAAALLIGAAFVFIAALGALRFPDVYTRMHAVSKATTLGLGCMLIGVAVSFPHLGVIAKIAVVLLFIFFTTPIATHMIARAAYLTGVPQWKGTVADEMKGRYTADSDESRSRQANDKSSQPTGTGDRRR